MGALQREGLLYEYVLNTYGSFQHKQIFLQYLQQFVLGMHHSCLPLQLPACLMHPHLRLYSTCFFSWFFFLFFLFFLQFAPLLTHSLSFQNTEKSLPEIGTEE